MKYLILLLLLPGCMTVYSISKIMPDGSNIVVEVKSYREFEQPQVHYHRTDEDGVTFDFGAASATTATSPVEQAAASLLLQLPTLLAPKP